MSAVLVSKRSNCKNCYKCIRSCPVKSIRFSGNQASIVEDECILCGQCVNICPQSAKEIRTDIENAKIMLLENEIVAASIAPSFISYYSGIGISTLSKALKKLGFYVVEETAAGAAIVAKRYEELLQERSRKLLISSSCPSVNLLIQKYYPQALPFLARVMTPVQAHCKVLKSQYEGIKTVFIGPCISKKYEADMDDSPLDLALTFEELDSWLLEEGIGLKEAEEGDDIGGRSRLFPTAGGIIRTMAKKAEYSYIAIDGVDNCINALKNISEENLDQCFIEMSACQGSCVGGPIMIKKHHHSLSGFLDVDKYASDKDFLIPETNDQFSRVYSYMGKTEVQPGHSAILEILKQMGKNSQEDELNCGSCGYNTCREKAVAVYQGKANYAMCLPFLKEKAESFSDNIIQNTPNSIVVLNEALEIQQINRAAMKLMNISSASYVMGEKIVCILSPEPFLEALETQKGIPETRQYLAEYDKYIEQTILYDLEYHILICIMRDVTNEVNSHRNRDVVTRKTIETADNVIAKQMRIAQEIASLLGETTAETKIALTKLKESFIDE